MISISKKSYRLEISLFVIPIILLFSNGCFSSKSQNQDIASVSLLEVIDNIQEVPISQLVDDLEYIPLEITPESAIGQDAKLRLTKDYIIVRNSGPGNTSLLLLFERKTGRFVRPIGKLGRGPEEYARPLDCFYNSFDNNVYAYGPVRSTIKVYNLDGKFIESFETPKITESSVQDGFVRVSIDDFFDKGTYIGYVRNSSGTINKKIVLFDKNNEIKSFPNNNIWTTSVSEQNVTIDQSPLFVLWQNSISFKERSNDTVFHIIDNKISPRLIFKTRDYGWPYKFSREEALDDIKNPKDRFEFWNIIENTNYLFFHFSFRQNELIPRFMKGYFLILNKKTNNTLVSQDNRTQLAALKDDINGFLSVLPQITTESNEMAAILNASDVIKWKKENPDKSIQLQSKLPWLANISDLDNPVVVIGKWK